jgi:Mycothiol maleylpyruvate isomerase N-terminal domain
MDFSWDESRAAFEEAGEWFVRMAALVGDRWLLSALGEWDVRALVGHTSRSFLTVEAYLDRPAQAVEVPSATEYLRVTRAIAAGPAVAQRGRDAGAALGADPAQVVAEIAERVVGDVASRTGSELVTTIVGGMRLADYLPTRTFELTVHTADLAMAIGEPLAVPPAPAAQALAIVADLAVTDGLAGRLLLLATGRSSVPSGFSVL